MTISAAASSWSMEKLAGRSSQNIARKSFPDLQCALREQTVSLKISSALAANCDKSSERRSWLARLPEIVLELERRWSLTIGHSFDGEEVSCAWVALVQLADHRSAVLKVGMPHFENLHEIEGLVFWNSDPTVRLFDSDSHLGALLLERCEPGTHLLTLPEPDQDIVIARMLQ